MKTLPTNFKYENKSRWLKTLSPEPFSKPPKKVSGTKVTILGCGPSTGVPILFCPCKTCTSKHPRNNRSRASITIQTGQTVFLIDTGPDLRAQAFREKLYWIDAVLYTHPHADHVHGIDELRTYNYILRRPIPCYGNRWTIDTVRKKFDYIFTYSQEGGGKPAIDLHLMDKKMKIAGVMVQPLPVIHGKMPVLGFRINNVAYITDCSYIPPQTLRYLKNLDVLVLDCLRYTEHPTHVNISQSIELAKKIGAKKTIFTHMAHEIEYEEFSKTLPKNIIAAYDGLTVTAK